jgi:hypothetical protein
MAISGYSINDYWWILVFINGYYISEYSCLLMAILLVDIGAY